MNPKILLIPVLFISSGLFSMSAPAGGPPTTSVTCDVPFNFDIDAGFVGSDPTTAAGSCGQCCFAGSDLDGDGQQDVSFSIENSEWFEWCNPTGSPITVTVGFDEPGGGGDCNIQGAVWVGAALDATTLDCNNPQFDEFGSNPGGGADGFTFTVTVPVGECAFFMVDGYAGTTCAGVEAVVPCPPALLPITLTSFVAESFDNKTVNLAWVTDTEINNDFFTIERSKDGETFEVIGIVDGAGNSTMVNSYGAEDNKPYKGISYYRLKQTDYNGEHYYSKTIAVKIETAFSDINVYPNPIEELGYLSFNSNVNDISEVVIYDVSGRVVLTQEYNTIKGNNKLKLPTINLRRGMYFLIISNKNEKSTIKFIKD